MNNQQWNPGHSINKGYPYERIESKHLFPNRIEMRQTADGHVGLHCSFETYPQAKEIFENDDKQGIIDFLMDRLFDFQEALNIAEDQIAEILTENPFIPEEFGFEIAYRPETPQDSPIRVYRSIHDDSITIHRPIADIESNSWDPAIWIMQQKKDGIFTNTTLSLPCHRIAYAAFHALGVQVEEKTKEESIGQDVSFEEVSNDVNVVLPKGSKLYNVMYSSGVTGKILTIESIVCEDDKDAMTQAKFLIETGDYGVDLVEFNELTPVVIDENI